MVPTPLILLETSPPCRASGIKPLQISKKQPKKLTQPCMKYVGLPIFTSKKPFFSVIENPIFGYFFTLAAFLAARDHVKSPGFIPIAL
jgi:hypothetical protein